MGGCKTVGIFRKEGNAARMNGSLLVFYGCNVIPATLHVHDICSWIKKFFRELKTPLFVNHEDQLVKYAEMYQLDPGALLSYVMPVLEYLPLSHVGALGYLMRCLKKVRL